MTSRSMILMVLIMPVVVTMMLPMRVMTVDVGMTMLMDVQMLTRSKRIQDIFVRMSLPLCECGRKRMPWDSLDPGRDHSSCFIPAYQQVESNADDEQS